MYNYENENELHGFMSNIYIKHLIKKNNLLTKKQFANLSTKTLDFIYKSYLRELDGGLKPIRFVTSNLKWKYKKWNRTSYKMISNIKKRTKIPFIIIDSFFRVLLEAVRIGKIKYKVVDPIGAKKDKKIKEKIVGKGTLDIMKDLGSKAETLTKMALVTGGIVGSYLLISKFKK